MKKPKCPEIGSIEYNTMVMKAEALEKQKAKEMADKIAERKAEHRFQIKLVLLTVVTTLFVEHIVEIFNFFCNLFHY